MQPEPAEEPEEVPEEEEPVVENPEPQPEPELPDVQVPEVDPPVEVEILPSKLSALENDQVIAIYQSTGLVAEDECARGMVKVHGKGCVDKPDLGTRKPVLHKKFQWEYFTRYTFPFNY